MDPTLKAKFEDAQKRVKELKRNPGVDALLDLYALFKQGSVGDVQGSRPGMLDLKGRKKYDAWAAVKGTSAERAMERYVALVDSLVAKDR
jgi:acyl-CoA-binding protein